jgi:heme/copper-type cytochrome/quinol oxidase subunit 1
MYMVTAFAFFAAGGIMALLMRAELARPGLQFLSLEQYNQLFTMHGTIMLLLFATPMVFAFANLVLPLQIGSPDVAFPRLNPFSYWLFLFGGLVVLGMLSMGKHPHTPGPEFMTTAGPDDLTKRSTWTAPRPNSKLASGAGSPPSRCIRD